MDEYVVELWEMYRYITVMNCSPAEYEERPYKETMWLLEIDKVHGLAQGDAQEKAMQQSHNRSGSQPPRR